MAPLNTYDRTGFDHSSPKCIGRVMALGILACTLPLAMLGQARLVINDNAYVRIDNGAWVVVENPATNAVTTSGTGGNLRSEGEFNRLRWQIRNNVGTYTVPFTSISGAKMPLTYTVTTAGSNETTASIVFSTYNHVVVPAAAANPWNNFLFKPSDVTHTNGFNTPTVNNSQNVVDRFWIIDAQVPGYAYVTKPAVVLGFVYDPNATDGEVTAGNAIISTSPVGAQRFNSGADVWQDFMPAGNWSAGATNSVTNVVVTAANFFRSWTLADINNPLPVELISFTGECEDKAVVLRWSTASEKESAHFVVERSLDGAVFTPIGRLEAAGDSQTMQEYVWYDKEPRSVAYYRLVQVDRDGNEEILGVRVSGCDAKGITEIVNAWDDGYHLNVVVRANSDQDHVMRLMDAGGKVMYAAPVQLYSGLTTIQVPKDGMAQGVYIVRFDGPGVPMSRRVTLLF